MDAAKRMKRIAVIEKIERNTKYAEKIGTKNISTFIQKDKAGRKGRTV